jgi:type VI secretion system protein ImpF
MSILPSRVEPEFVLSVLDRLIDDEPDDPDEIRPHWVGSLEQIKDSVRSNLIWLLNSRRALVDLPPGRHHLQRSLLAYGLPDFTHVSIGTTDERDLLRAAIESVIRRFEPRLSQVVVSRPEAEPNGRNLQFQVTAVLNVRPVPEHVSFDSVLLLPARTFELRG